MFQLVKNQIFHETCAPFDIRELLHVFQMIKSHFTAAARDCYVPAIRVPVNQSATYCEEL